MKISSNYTIPNRTTAKQPAYNTSFTAKHAMTSKTPASAAIGGFVLVMLPNIVHKHGSETDTPSDKDVTSLLGESLMDPAFPTEFNDKVFKKWADLMGLSYQVRAHAAEFKDVDGNLVRRIEKKANDESKVFVDRIWIFKDGKEVANFLKYADEPNIKYHYDRTPYGGYNCAAELRSDGLWYDYKNRTGIMRTNPITGEIQIVPMKVNSPLGESLRKPSFPTDYDVQEFENWAKALGLPAPVIEDGLTKFYDNNGHLVRQIRELKKQKGKVQDDYVWVYDNNVLVGKYSKYYISDSPKYSYEPTEYGDFKYAAQLGKDGYWRCFGRDWDKILPKNPVTGEPQCQI